MTYATVDGVDGSSSSRKRRGWVPIVVGVLVLLAFLAAGGIFAAVSFFRQNLSVGQGVDGNTAVGEFDAVYARFPGQQPLIELVDEVPQLVAERASRTSAAQSLTTLHVLAFDRDDGELARFTAPFWLLRLKSGPIRLSAYQQGWDDRGVSFRVEDIEKHGPGIIIDVKERRDGRLLVWAE